MAAWCFHCKSDCAGGHEGRWGCHGRCRIERHTRLDGLVQCGRPLSFLVAWLELADGADDYTAHLQLSKNAIDMGIRLEVRNRIQDDPAYAAALGCERPRRPGEPIEHKRNPG